MTKKNQQSAQERIAVLIPCYNEAVTIGKVVCSFREALPQAEIIVCDNNSSDATAEIAAKAGARVLTEKRQGKGFAVQKLFAEVNADIYLMIDGDDTYPAASAEDLIKPVRAGQCDMSVGSRLQKYEGASFRPFHRFGNRLIGGMINVLFKRELKDVLSGYRAFSHRFVKSLPLLSGGFEVETELTLQAVDKGLEIEEVKIHYGERPQGSVSKLNTFSDGLLIAWTIFRLLKDYRPLLFFGSIALVALLAGFSAGVVVIREFLQSGLILHLPLAVFAVGSVLSGLIALAVGLILDTVNLRFKELSNIQAKNMTRDRDEVQ